MPHASGFARRLAARFVPGFSRDVRCGGCGRSNADVTHMIAGPGVYICDRCVEQAARQLTPHHPPPDAVRCQFCHQLRAKDDVTAVENLTVCADCLGVAAAIVAEAKAASRPAT